jgi:hypothetical protein
MSGTQAANSIRLSADTGRSLQHIAARILRHPFRASNALRSDVLKYKRPLDHAGWSEKATSRRVAMMAPLAHEARAELKVVVLDADFVALLVKNVGDFTRDSGHRRDMRLSPYASHKVGYRDCKELWDSLLPTANGLRTSHRFGWQKTAAGR